MIILYSKKININFNEIMQMYLNVTNFCHLECPNCHSHDFIRWGHYERNVIFFSDDGNDFWKMAILIKITFC